MGNAKDFEWARERMLREKKNPTVYRDNRATFLLNQVKKTDGEKAMHELYKEFKSK